MQAEERINCFLSMNRHIINIQHIENMNEHQLESFRMNMYPLKDSNDDQFFLYTLSIVSLHGISNKVLI